MNTLTIHEIETRRKAMGLTQIDLCKAANVTATHYCRIIGGKVLPRPLLLSKLQLALTRHRIGFGAEARDLAPHVAFKAVVALVALEMKADVRLALDAKPSRRAVMDPQWLQAAQCRMVAYAVTNGCFGMTTADIARAAGVDKSTVSLGIRQINDRRDKDEKLDAVLNRLEAIFG
ncbi:MAG: hypothetical protein ACRCU5_13960 [Rhizobiaceae bacterium]